MKSNHSRSKQYKRNKNKKVEKSRHHEPEIVEEFHENKVEQEYDPYLDPTSTVNNTIAVDEYLYNNQDNSFDINY